MLRLGFSDVTLCKTFSNLKTDAAISSEMLVYPKVSSYVARNVEYSKECDVM
jgi:hypothetical protein